MANLLNPNQNLLRQVTPEEAARPRGFYWGIVFDVIAVGAAFAASYAYVGYLTKDAPLAWVLVAGSAFAALHAVTFLLIKVPAHRRWLVALETLGLFSFFILFPQVGWRYLAAMAVAVFLFLLLGDRQSRNEMENGMKFRFLKVTHPLLAKTASALVLIGVLVGVANVERDPNFFKSKSFLDVSGWTASLTERFYPGFKQDATVEAIAMKLAETQLASNEQFATLDPASRERVEKSVAEELIRNFEAQSGVRLDSQGTLQSALYEFVSAKLASWYEAYPRPFLFGWAVFLFFVFRSIGAALAVAVALVAFLVYEILLATNVIHLSGESRLHETIELS